MTATFSIIRVVGLTLLLILPTLFSVVAAASGEADESCSNSSSSSSCTIDYYNEAMNADNVFEIDVDPKVVLDVRADYEKDVKPYLKTGKSTDDFCLVSPYNPEATTWKFVDDVRSDIKWYSVNNEKTYEKYLEHVNRLGLFDAVRERNWIQSENLTVYSMFLIVRSFSKKYQFHEDWSEQVGTQIATFLVPLSDFYVGLAYKDNDGKTKKYDYKLGKAVGLGGGFMHSTGKGQGEEEDVLLCVYIGSDDPKIWKYARRNIDDELEHYMSPSRGFIRNENLKGGPSKCE
mmetsp:Transcript_19953/g.29558  ORF Transcript_19953/g.29558 Transcript_19953/m.29558 type:complete len:289 (-) Transcript_19953:117-983(-)